MSKIIVYVDGDKVTGYEVLQPNILAAFRIGLDGAEAVTYDRAVKQLGADVVATLTKTAPQLSIDEALTKHAGKSGRAFLIVDRVPSGEFDTWKIAGGKVVANA